VAAGGADRRRNGGQAARFSLYWLGDPNGAARIAGRGSGRIGADRAAAARRVGRGSGRIGADRGARPMSKNALVHKIA